MRVSHQSPSRSLYDWRHLTQTQREFPLDRITSVDTSPNPLETILRAGDLILKTPSEACRESPAWEAYDNGVGFRARDAFLIIGNSFPGNVFQIR
jgi:PH (Pleckstrin Homology) domain-containing protein